MSLGSSGQFTMSNSSGITFLNIIPGSTGVTAPINFFSGLNFVNKDMTGCGLINGISVERHGLRHLSGGADAISFGATTAYIVGLTNSIGGSVASYARADHAHIHGGHTDGSLHIVGTTNISGFMGFTYYNYILSATYGPVPSTLAVRFSGGLTGAVGNAGLAFRNIDLYSYTGPGYSPLTFLRLSAPNFGISATTGSTFYQIFFPSSLGSSGHQIKSGGLTRHFGYGQGLGRSGMGMLTNFGNAKSFNEPTNSNLDTLFKAVGNNWSSCPGSRIDNDNYYINHFLRFGALGYSSAYAWRQNNQKYREIRFFEDFIKPGFPYTSIFGISRGSGATLGRGMYGNTANFSYGIGHNSGIINLAASSTAILMYSSHYGGSPQGELGFALNGNYSFYEIGVQITGISALSGTDQIRFRAGYSDVIPANSSTIGAAYLDYDESINQNWGIQTAHANPGQGVGQTLVRFDTGITVEDGKFYRIGYRWFGSNPLRVYINEVNVLSTNPGGNTGVVCTTGAAAAVVQLQKVTGTTFRGVNIDYIYSNKIHGFNTIYGGAPSSVFTAYD